MTALVQALLHRLPYAPAARDGAPPGRRLIGPGLLVAVGYIDPGNWATDIAAGSRYAYALLGTVVFASLLGLLFQSMAARLAVATGEDLASLSRRLLPRPLALLAWGAGELAIVATALAELVGGAVALQLLFGLRLELGLVASAAGTLAILALSQRRQRLHENVVGILLATVALSFLYLLLQARPDPAAVAGGLGQGLAVFGDHGMLAMALGILGATVMPHNLYLHSGLVAERSAGLPPSARPQALRLSAKDTRFALGLAMLVNAAMLVVAAASLRGGQPVGSLAEAHQAIALGLGGGAALVFALALYAAGQSSAITGVMAGRLLTRGFRGRESSSWLRGIATRLLALCAGFALLASRPGAGADSLLILSQCVLGLALPFALLPMLLLAHRRGLMGALAFGRGTLAAGLGAAVLVTGLDGYLLAGMLP
ncbi:Nramp family divalent metal transporter [Frateuria defendens]|uniref:Nramp family divalent metal transporter n=1 Tax=Frateuria defendens TaxID=2219559 RepID=UPI00069E952A|nr:Nramp family divalent metal transporter [Frateuria defendens]